MSTSLPNLNLLFNEIVNSQNVNLVEWLLFGFILVGLIIKILSFNIHTTVTQDQLKAGIQTIGPATGTIWGYSIILFSALGLIFISVNPEKENMEQIENVPLSLYAIIIILVWSIILNFRFYDKINTTHVMPHKYKVWNNWSIVVILLLCAFCILEYLINTIKNDAFNGLKMQIRVFTIIVFFSAVVVMGILDTILNNFLVDG